MEGTRDAVPWCDAEKEKAAVTDVEEQKIM
jgi:hypothetical protein